MNFKSVEEIAEAVLYEGYMLYPYRPSSVKNQQRFNFGVLCPKTWCNYQAGPESHSMHTETLLRATPSSRVTVKVRFLHVVQRLIRECNDADSAQFVDRLEVDGRVYQPWQEAEERSFAIDGLDLASPAAARTIDFSFPAGESLEQLRDAQGCVVGAVVRQWQGLAASLQVNAEPVRGDVLKLTVCVENHTTPVVGPFDRVTRDEALLRSLVSAHAVMGIDGGEFLSLLEPPAGFEDLAAGCQNVGAWPVLAGEDATTVLASPIILYDFPKIAPESVGNLFDGTEIDEILSLRILTLTDAEKTEIRQSDDRARMLLERTENIPAEQFMKLHGVLRGMSDLGEAQK